MLHASWTEWKNIFSLEIYCRSAKLQVDGLARSYGPQRLTIYSMKPELGPPDVETIEFPAGRRVLESRVAGVRGCRPRRRWTSTRRRPGVGRLRLAVRRGGVRQARPARSCRGRCRPWQGRQASAAPGRGPRRWARDTLGRHRAGHAEGSRTRGRRAVHLPPAATPRSSAALDASSLCVGHLGDQIVDAVGDGGRFGVEVLYAFDGPEPVGTAGALRRRRRSSGGVPRHVRRCVSPIDHASVQRAFEARGLPGLMTVLQNDGDWEASNAVFEKGACRRTTSGPAVRSPMDRLRPASVRARVFEDRARGPLRRLVRTRVAREPGGLRRAGAVLRDRHA